MQRNRLATILGLVALSLICTAAVEGADSGPITPGAELTLKQAIEIALEFHPRRQQAISESGRPGKESARRDRICCRKPMG